jgi:hypothetical protein
MEKKKKNEKGPYLFSERSGTFFQKMRTFLEKRYGPLSLNMS